jgi:ribosomal protein L29
MKVGEFRDLGAEELRQREKDLDGKLKVLRRDLARVKMVLREKELA